MYINKFVCRSLNCDMSIVLRKPQMMKPIWFLSFFEIYLFDYDMPKLSKASALFASCEWFMEMEISSEFQLSTFHGFCFSPAHNHITCLTFLCKYREQFWCFLFELLIFFCQLNWKLLLSFTINNIFLEHRFANFNLELHIKLI